MPQGRVQVQGPVDFLICCQSAFKVGPEPHGGVGLPVGTGNVYQKGALHHM